jgi:hypothetical protein
VADDALAADAKPTCKNDEAILPRVLDQISSNFIQKKRLVWSLQEPKRFTSLFLSKLHHFLISFSLMGIYSPPIIGAI